MGVDQEIQHRFADRYRAAQSAVTRELELAVTGGDWGANGYTTVEEADVLARSLRLGPNTRVLDLGAGRGWPSLYFAKATACEAVLLDPPIEGLAAAVRRATEEGLSATVAAVEGSARHLPLRPGTFDAVVHTDVLCCVTAKHEALRACSRVLRPGGRTAFTVIHTAPGLGAADRRRARRDGPRAVTSRSTYPAMLQAAGFTEIVETDLTESFAAVAAAWLEERERRRPGLVALHGTAAFDDRQADGRAQLDAVLDGVLRRSMLEAVRP